MDRTNLTPQQETRGDRDEPRVGGDHDFIGPRRIAAKTGGAGPAPDSTSALPDYDLVDEQSRQSFPASDPPSWPGSSI